MLALIACDQVVRANHYAGMVLVHLSPQPIESIVRALEEKLDLEGPRPVIGGVPNCKYYHDKIIAKGVEISISLCHGPNKNSETGWGVDLVVTTPGRNLEGRKELDKYVEKARYVMETVIPDHKVTVSTLAFY